MTGLVVSSATVRFGDFVALDEVGLAVDPGRVLALLGPSGSGKSTLLRAIAGLQPLDAGTVCWDGDDFTLMPPHRRGFGMVFQDGQLFSNLDVGRNIAYGLAGRRTVARRARVEEMLELVGLPGLEHRRTTELSGGQAQRVALARSLAPSPRLLLLDEPLSALEHGLRRRLATEVSRILHQVGTTAVYVTHDLEEASMVGDVVAVMEAGHILQVAAPEVLWRRPASIKVATFLGATAFLEDAEARELGWSQAVPEGHVLGVLPGQLVSDPTGLPCPILDQELSLDRIHVGVRLPNGQRAVVVAEERPAGGFLRVRLASAAQVPAAPTRSAPGRVER